MAYTTGGGNTITPPRVSTVAVSSDGTIYAPASGALEVMNSAGQVQWTFGTSSPPSQQPAGVPSSGIGPDGTIFLVGDDGVVTAVNPTTHQQKWTYQMGCASSNNCGAPAFPVIDSQGDSYWGSLDYNLYALNSQGQLLFKYKTGAGIAEAAPAMDSGGNLYFSSDDGYTYALAGPAQATTSTTSASSTTATSSSTSSTSSSTSTTSATTSTSSSTVTVTVTVTSSSTSTSSTTASSTTSATASTTLATTTASTSASSSAVPEFPGLALTAALAGAVLVAATLVKAAKGRGQP